MSIIYFIKGIVEAEERNTIGKLQELPPGFLPKPTPLAHETDFSHAGLNDESIAHAKRTHRSPKL